MYPLTFSICSVIFSLPLLFLPASTASNDQFTLPWRHLNYNETVQYLHQLRANYPHLVTLQSIGKSVQGRDLWVIRLSNNSVPDSAAGNTAAELDFTSALNYYLHNRTVLKPTVRLVGAIHGDEALGKHLLLALAEHLVSSYHSDARIGSLLNSTDIELLPLMNPDGFEVAKEGDCYGVRSKHMWNGRENANKKDLEENFLSNFESNDAALRKELESETLAVITWIVSNPSFVLAASIHTGALVVSYPLDGQKAITADDLLFRHLATNYVLGYANSSQFIKGCTPNEDFNDGIVIGNKWNIISNSMADFTYQNTNCLELNLYLSCCKYPNASALRTEWDNNRESLLQFIESAHIGIKGTIIDAVSKSSVKGAKVSVASIAHNVTTTEQGEYWRLLLPGTYSITVSAYGYQSETRQVRVTNNRRHQALEVDFELKQTTATHETEEQNEFPEFQSPTEFVHHDYLAMEKVLKELAAKYPAITRLYSAGQSVEKRELYVLEISDNPGVHELGEPEFKYVANMHGNEVVGKEMLLLLAKLLLENYGKHSNITSIVDNTRLHLMPSMNPDGWERSNVGDCDSLVGRGNAHKVDLNRNFPDQYRTYEENQVQEPETQVIMEWLKSYPFVLSANLHGGSLVSNYPFDGNNHTDRTDGYSQTPDDALFRHLASVYSKNHPFMHLGECHEKCSNELNLLNEHFKDGIINGAQWYALYGGMQDWNYLHTNCYEITVEMGCRKYPLAKDLPRFWRDNRRALLVFINEVHKGIKGVVRDGFTNMSLADVAITVEGIDHAVHSVAPHGDYWRLLLPGTYQVKASKAGYQSQTRTVQVTDQSALWVDFTLQRAGTFAGDSSHPFVSLLCLVIAIIIAMCVVFFCCPGVVQQASYLCGTRRKGQSAAGALLAVICCRGAKRSTSAGKPVDSFHYTKLNATDTVNLYESEDEEDLAFDQNALLRK